MENAHINTHHYPVTRPDVNVVIIFEFFYFHTVFLIQNEIIQKEQQQKDIGQKFDENVMKDLIQNLDENPSENLMKILIKILIKNLMNNHRKSDQKSDEKCDQQSDETFHQI